MEASGTGSADDKESPFYATAAIMIATAIEEATDAQKEAALANAALACVAWDESVDVGRLLLLEHERDVDLFRRIVAKAGARLADYDEDRSFEFINDARAISLNVFLDAKYLCRKSAYVYRCDGALWSVGKTDDRRLTDAQASSWLALCARHRLLSLEYDVPRRAERDSAYPNRGSNYEEEHHGHTWLASVARGLASRAGAWTGIEAMRTRTLCLVLLALLDARTEGGPLAVVDLPGGESVDQGAVPSPADRRKGDDALLASMAGALTQAEHVRQLGFAFFVGHAGDGHLDLHSHAGHTRQVLSMVYAGVDRLYATEAFYLQVIAPAEYKAMADNAPLGSAIFH
ncbi:hypothetical protein pdul_cds_898 [Pandoravirus dulcis]|uniref:Uncharacterized protein n=1 Tax=Pandoravirus dulcis TaxID=1349409 RepID=S4VZ43_9VIRU|nr:hypothetical protein pdul_cds_898 [Pandoravirus dulcis]AGO83129.1 hypothetical protein pdul_cds_898 [Pandoravirus dulcis]